MEIVPARHKEYFFSTRTGISFAALWMSSGLLEGKLPLQPEQLNSVRKNKLILQRIASKNRTIEQRRRLLCQRREGNAAIDLLNIVKEYF